MSWTREQISVLLDAYESHPVLYNTKDTMYHNKGARTDSLQKIVDELLKIRPNTTGEMVKSKLNSLRTQFNKEMAAIKNKPSGSGTSSCHVPSLWCFERMLFLQDHVAAKKSWCNVEPQAAVQEGKQQDVQCWVDVLEGAENAENECDRSAIHSQEEELWSPTPTCSSVGNSTKRSSKRKLNNAEDVLLGDIRSTLDKVNAESKEDECDKFGQYIASEMKTMNSVRRKKLRMDILRQLLKHQEEELENA